MEKDKKVSYIKEKQLSKISDKNYSTFLKQDNAQNPIRAKFLAFQKTKKDIHIKDLF